VLPPWHFRDYPPSAIAIEAIYAAAPPTPEPSTNHRHTGSRLDHGVAEALPRSHWRRGDRRDRAARGYRGGHLPRQPARHRPSAPGQLGRGHRQYMSLGAKALLVRRWGFTDHFDLTRTTALVPRSFRAPRRARA